MEFNQTTTFGVFAVLLVVLLGGTLTSPMPQSVSLMVGGGLLAFGVVTLYVGIKHGEYRATH